MDSATCGKTENGFYRWKCTSGRCKDCKLVKPLQLKCATSNATVKVPQFKTTETPYNTTDKKTGEKKEKI